MPGEVLKYVYVYIYIYIDSEPIQGPRDLRYDQSFSLEAQRSTRPVFLHGKEVSYVPDSLESQKGCSGRCELKEHRMRLEHVTGVVALTYIYIYRYRYSVILAS